MNKQKKQQQRIENLQQIADIEINKKEWWQKDGTFKVSDY